MGPLSLSAWSVTLAGEKAEDRRLVADEAMEQSTSALG